MISGYLITLLLIGEHERTGAGRLGQFWLRRARRLLPALFTLLIGITIYTALFRRDALGQLRGDVVAALAYVSNWYQIWVGQGYTASATSLPCATCGASPSRSSSTCCGRSSWCCCCASGGAASRRLSWGCSVSALAIAAVVAAALRRATIGTPDVTPDGVLDGRRPLHQLDFLYLSTPTRAGGLLLGAAFAMVWRPAALMRGPMRRGPAARRRRRRRPRRPRRAVWTCTSSSATRVARPVAVPRRLPRHRVATVLVIAAVTHQRSATGRLLGTPLFVWIGTRSYGLYLYHWPIYQGSDGWPDAADRRRVRASRWPSRRRRRARRTGGSRCPMRRQELGRMWRRLQRTASINGRRALAAFAALVITFVGVGVAGLATARCGRTRSPRARRRARQRRATRSPPRRSPPRPHRRRRRRRPAPRPPRRLRRPSRRRPRPDNGAGDTGADRRPDGTADRASNGRPATAPPVASRPPGTRARRRRSRATRSVTR